MSVPPAGDEYYSDRPVVQLGEGHTRLWFSVLLPPGANLVPIVKQISPWRHRKWSPERHVWMVRVEHKDRLVELLTQAGAIVQTSFPSSSSSSSSPSPASEPP